MTRSPSMMSTLPLQARDAVAAIIVVDGEGYLLQHRDDLPEIWYPDHWGCFGGAMEPGETPEAALQRELDEELGCGRLAMRRFASLNFDVPILGPATIVRHYYEVTVTSGEVERFVLGEGRAMTCVDREGVLCRLRVVPYDAFALFLHIGRDRFAPATSGSGA